MLGQITFDVDGKKFLTYLRSVEMTLLNFHCHQVSMASELNESRNIRRSRRKRRSSCQSKILTRIGQNMEWSSLIIIRLATGRVWIWCSRVLTATSGLERRLESSEELELVCQSHIIRNANPDLPNGNCTENKSNLT